MPRHSPPSARLLARLLLGALAQQSVAAAAGRLHSHRPSRPGRDRTTHFPCLVILPHPSSQVVAAVEAKQWARPMLSSMPQSRPSSRRSGRTSDPSWKRCRRRKRSNFAPTSKRALAGPPLSTPSGCSTRAIPRTMCAWCFTVTMLRGAPIAIRFGCRCVWLAVCCLPFSLHLAPSFVSFCRFCCLPCVSRQIVGLSHYTFTHHKNSRRECQSQ